MTHESQRDQSIERLLRQAAGRASLPATASECLDGELLAAWSSGTLAPSHAARVEGHVADCLRCQAMVAAFLRIDTAAPTPAPSQRWWTVRWLVPLATAATIAAIWVALPNRSPSAPESAQLQSRADATPPVDETKPPAASAPATPLPDLREPATSDASVRNNRTADRGRESAREARQQPAAAATSAPAAPPPAAAEQLATAQRVGAGVREERAGAAAPQAMARFKAAVAFVEIASPGGPARWRFAPGSPLEHSEDGGVTWQRVDLPASEALTAGHSPGGAVAWLVGRRGTVYVTTNGRRFERVPFVEPIDLTNVVAVDDRQATVTAVDGRSFTTTTRGSSWK